MMNFDEIIDRRHSNCVKYNEQATLSRPTDAIVMTLADMDLAVCPAIQKAIVKRAELAVYGYQKFSEEVPQLICDWYQRRSHAQFHVKDCLITPSVNTAIAFVLRALTKQGDSVLIQNPSYSPFRHVVQLNDREVILTELVYQDGHYGVDFEDFERKCKVVKAFILCSPQNPTSKVFSREELTRMLTICRRHQVLVIVDEIHLDWIYGDMVCASSLDNQVITLVSGSKTFNLQGLQTSFLFVPDVKAREAVQRQMDAIHYSNNQVFSHAAYKAAFSEEGESWLNEAKKYVHANGEYINHFFLENQLPLRATNFHSTFLMWVDCSGCCKSDEEVVDLFENQCHIYGTTGSHYNTETPFIRLNIGLARPLIVEMCQRLKNALQK